MHGLVQRLRYRTIWISDIQLGTRGCKAEYLHDFLRNTESETLYLVGDIFDAWRLRRSWYRPQAHNDVVRKLLRKARNGTRLIYLTDNHDEALRHYAGMHFGGVRVVNERLHATADGRRLLVVHGDRFDGIVRYARWLALLGDWAYSLAPWINHWFNVIRRQLGFGYWSLSAYLKNKVKNAVGFIENYAQAMIAEARRRGAQGVACGGAIRGSSSPAPRRATSWRATSPRPTSSSFPAAPTPSAWSCSRRWPAACRSPPSRRRGRSTWSTGRRSGAWTRTSRRPPAAP